MNTIIGTLTLKWNNIIPKEFDFDIVESLEKNGNKTIFFFWETQCKNADEFLEENKNILWNIIFSDISLSNLQNVFLDLFDYEEWIYEVASFEWEQITFSEIKSRFKEVDEVISIRECEISKRFWNSIIRVDFIY